MEHEKTKTVSTSHSVVEGIVGSLSELESDIDKINSQVDEMKRRLMAQSNDQIDQLKQQIITMATEEAKKIVDSAKAEAEAESATILKEAEKNLAAIKKNIEASFDKAVDSIIKTVLETSETPKVEAKPEKKEKPVVAPKIKKYSSDGKPLN